MADRLPPSSSTAHSPMWRPARIGHFEVLRSISSTPMMDTYIVHDGDATRILRLMAPWLSDDATFRTDFERMATSVVGLDHPSLGRSYEFGVIEDRLYTLGEHFLTPSLRSMNHTLNARAILTGATIRRIALELCAGLHAVHTLKYTEGDPIQLLYRDPFPGYMFFHQDGSVVLRDPGPWSLSWLNHKRYIIRDRSTEPYRSPEDVLGEELDVSSDLYTLTRTLLMTRHPAPLHASPQRVSKQLDDALAHLRSEAPRFAAVLRKATHPERDARYQSAEEMAADIEPLTDDEQKNSIAEARLFLEETRSATRKKPGELSSSLRKIARIQQLDSDAPATRPSGSVVRRRSQTIDLPLGSLPDLKALRDAASLDRSSGSGDYEITPEPFDAPPPSAVSYARQDRADQGLSLERQNTATRSGDYPPTPAGPPATSPSPTITPRTPDQRVQTLTQGIRELIHRPDAALLRSAAQDRLSGNSARALQTLSRIGSDAPADVQSAARLERGFALLEEQQHADAAAVLTPCLADFLHPGDQAILRYYLALAALAADDHPSAYEHLEAIPLNLRGRFPDLAPVFLALP